jgi:hypothetical protein
MPVNEILTSAPTRSAFLQSLQRSREREEGRERDMEIKDRDRDQFHQSDSPTPIMSRRRISSPSTPSKPNTPPLKAVNSPSKLASHAFTMSSSSSSENTNSNDSDFRRRYETDFYSSVNNNNSVVDNVESSKTSWNPNTNTPISSWKTTSNSSNVSSVSKKSNDSNNNYSHVSDSLYTTSNTKDALYTANNTLSNNHSNIQELIDASLEAHTSSIKNDLQNLHVELIKQSLAQQNAFRTLLETYLPLTGKLMDTLAETRQENENLKLRIEELSRRRY